MEMHSLSLIHVSDTSYNMFKPPNFSKRLWSSTLNELTVCWNGLMQGVKSSLEAEQLRDPGTSRITSIRLRIRSWASGTTEAKHGEPFITNPDHY